ncbi:hypothetical protein PMAYCL1PPCAC_09006, partial [Pristionchus mayeri]
TDKCLNGATADRIRLVAAPFPFLSSSFFSSFSSTASAVLSVSSTFLRCSGDILASAASSAAAIRSSADLGTAGFSSS